MAADGATQPPAAVAVVEPNTFRLHFRNPFVLRIGQVMTGFGIGCGVGIGVGRPINLGQVPVIGQALSGSGGLTRSFGSTGYQVQRLIKRLGIKNLEAGVGCGVGVGYGFGAGIALKPGVSQQLMLFLQNRLEALASRFRVDGNLPVSGEESSRNAHNTVISNLQSSPLVQAFSASPEAERENLGPNSLLSRSPSRSSLEESSKVFETKTDISQMEALRTENEILRTLLRHQKQIEDLKEEHAVLLRALKSGGQNNEQHPDVRLECVPDKRSTACFECRRKARRRW